jgi:uncharacterized membrane protein
LGRINRSIEIKARPEKIWPIVFWDRVPEWFDIIKKAEQTSKIRDGLGASAHVLAEAGGIKAIWDSEVSEWKENEKIAWHSTGGQVAMTSSMTFNPIKNGTKMTFEMDYNLPYSIFGKVIDVLWVGKDIDKSNERGMKKIKELFE